MNISCDKDELTRGVGIVIRAVSNKNTLPILSGILLETGDDQLHLSATDLEIGIRCSIPARIEEHGKLVLPARYFGEMVKRFPSGPVQLTKEVDSWSVRINYAQAELHLNGMEPDQFPPIPLPSEHGFFTVESILFRQMIKQVAIALSHDVVRQIFTGIMLEMQNDGSFSLVATDTHRLAVRRGNLGVHGELPKTSIIVPGRTLVEVSRLIEEEEYVRFSLAGNQIVFEGNETVLISRLIDGQFPTYQQVLPSGWRTRVLANTRELQGAVERASLLVREDPKIRANIINMKLAGNTLIVDSNSPEVGRIHEEIPVDFEGEEMEITFNARYLLDVLKVIDSDQIAMEWTGPLSAAIFRPVDEVPYFCLILPMRVQ